ncbi:MAG: hypothetical protein RLZ98_3150 [Pseudomonadota bacterium]|jgi:murein L,D-transpeptidase YafK
MIGAERSREYESGRRRGALFFAFAFVALTAAACAKLELPAHLKPLPEQTVMQLGKLKMTAADPIFVRIFKEESELEVWKQRSDGHFYHFKTYPICNWSGTLGPKIKQGDKQSPEGFYQVKQTQMNPNSSFHLAFNIGFPNQFDRANRRTGDFLMVHGKCRSAGCYAMTDALMEEIYALARESFIGGQSEFSVHAFPFRMTDANMARHMHSPHIKFWQTLKEGYDYFEITRKLPEIAICERRYVVNVAWPGGKRRNIDSRGSCPRFDKPEIVAFKGDIGQPAAVGVGLTTGGLPTATQPGLVGSVN